MSGERKKVLIVDDDVDILDALQMTFESWDFETRTVSKAEETFTQVEEFKPDVIVLDVLLSGKDGRVICKNLKNNTFAKHIPIIMVSAHPDAARSTIAAGANDFVAKPFDIKTLLHTVQKNLALL